MKKLLNIFIICIFLLVSCQDRKTSPRILLDFSNDDSPLNVSTLKKVQSNFNKIINLNSIVEIKTNKKSHSVDWIGFFISKGYIVSVLKGYIEGSELFVSTYNKEYKAEIVRIAKDSEIAILKIDNDSDYPYIEISLDDVYIGDIVFTIGNPFGIGLSSSYGVISSIDNCNYYNKNTALKGRNCYITDIQPNLVNNGSPLINIYGKVIGIFSFRISGNYPQNDYISSYVISSDSVNAFLKSLY